MIVYIMLYKQVDKRKCYMTTNNKRFELKQAHI